jgi:EAL domain-containing protein (putative c-di-GMP-specific phosphodiesterase class I)/ActR/RegA family two-component response regulator
MKEQFTLQILDDDVQYAGLLVDVAATEGWDAVAYHDPIEYLKENVPKSGILVLDLIMPGMDGIEVIRSLAKQKCKLSLILISGFDSRVLHSAQQLAEAHNIKVHASLTKPLSIGEFVSVLENIEADPNFDRKIVLQQKPISVNELEQAIRENQFIPYYQPLIDLKTNKLHSLELLIRWQHPERGLITPDLFIPFSEQTKLINPITNIVIRHALKHAVALKDIGLNVPISINISSENIASLNFPEQLSLLIEEHKLKAENITLEITEGSVLGELTSSLDVLNRLRMKGFILSIDDFGTGHASLSQLYQAPFAVLKIDKGFVMRMLNDNEAMVIVKICIMLGNMLGMKVVAEGIESEEVWDELKKLGCDIGQGYWIKRPMPENEFANWYQNFSQRKP